AASGSNSTLQTRGWLTALPQPAPSQALPAECPRLYAPADGSRDDNLRDLRCDAGSLRARRNSWSGLSSEPEPRAVSRSSEAIGARASQLPVCVTIHV